jgi:serine phosphatase RsbU (regulator of sigma subunit)
MSGSTPDRAAERPGRTGPGPAAAPGDTRARLDLAELLAAVENASPVAAADVLAAGLAQALGAYAVSLLLADFSGHALVRLGHAGSEAAGRTQGRETAERVPLAGSPHGRALSRQTLEIERDAGGARLFAPVTNRGEAIGVLELSLPQVPDEDTRTQVALAAHVLAYVIVANRRFTDLFEWGQRSVKLSLAAEIQHRLLPGSYTCEAGQFTLAAWLEPSGDIAGDTFDFALERDTLHLSMTDAMGHAVNASVLATVLVGGLRNARRAGVGLGEQAHLASAGLGDYVGWGQFVTGQVARIDLRAQTATVVNAGHPLPLRLRAGHVTTVDLEPDPPFGAFHDAEYHVQQLPLEPGDRLIFFTDGMMERKAAAVDLEALLVAGADRHPREAVQHLVHALLEATDGTPEDDATVMCLDWHGGPPRDRLTDSGADD